MRAFATHFTADLYLCRRKLWEQPDGILTAIQKMNAWTQTIGLHWFFPGLGQDWIGIHAEINEASFRVQILPKESFLMLDIFSWGQQSEPHIWGESLIELFEPQVVVVESKIRAEHLDG